MVQMSTPISYDGNMADQNTDPQGEKDWSKAIQASIHEFVISLSESSRQLAIAAEKFAGESLQVINDSAARTSINNEVASAAHMAAEEARSVAEGVRQSLNEVVDRLREEASQLFQEAGNPAAQADETGPEINSRPHETASQAGQTDFTQQIKNDLRDRMNDVREQARLAADQVKAEIKTPLQQAIQRAEQSINNSEAASTDAHRAAFEAGQASEKVDRELQRIDSAVERLESDLRATQQAGEQMAAEVQRLNQAVNRIEASIALSESEAASAAQHTADQALAANRDLANQIEGLSAAVRRLEVEVSRPVDASVNSAPSTDTTQRDHDLLAGLEADYQLLKQLVQDLHDRINGTSDTPEQDSPPTAEEPVSTSSPDPQPQPRVWQTWPNPETNIDTLAVSNLEPAEDTQEPVAWYADSPQLPEAAPEDSTGPADPQTSSQEWLQQGRIMVRLSAVPDFDRLLNLDAALGHMQDVRGVILANYAREEVSFRIEIETAISAEEFARRLSESAGYKLQLVSSSQDQIDLRLVI